MKNIMKIMMIIGILIATTNMVGCGKAADSLLGDMESSNEVNVQGNDNKVNINSDGNTSTTTSTTTSTPSNE